VYYILTQKDGVNSHNEITTFSYDEESEFWRKITTIKDRNGKISKRIHDRDGQLIRLDDQLEHKTNYTYDGDKNRTSIEDPVGYTTIYEYDKNGNLTATVDAEEHRVTYTYDENRNLLSTSDSSGAKVYNSYDENNLLKNSVDERGNKTTYTYDKNGQMLTKKVEGLGVLTNTYNEKGLLETASDYNGNVFTYEYDSIGRSVAVTDREDGRTSITYDNIGNILSKTDPLGNTIKYTYDSRGNVLSETDSRGNTSTFKYNGNGMLIEVTDPNKNKTTYEYDNEDRLIKVTDPKGLTAENVYDDAGRIISTKDALGNVTSYTYDDNGMLLSEKSPGGGTASFTYYRNGSIKTATDESGNTTTYTYDTMWRPAVVTNCNGSKTTRTYDVSGNVLNQKDALGNMVYYTYDSFSNLTSVKDARGNTTKYAYNAHGNMTSVTDALGNTTQYEYDKEDRLVKIINAKGYEKQFFYDKAGSMTKAIDELGNVVTTEYDASGNIVAVKDAYGVDITKIKYDKMNNPVEVEDALGNVVVSKYDSIGRLVEIVDQLNRTTKYSYDSMNRLTKAVDPLSGESSHTYDKDGNVTSYTDPNGNTTSLKYDKAGRLISETTAIGSTKTYGYNSLNLLETYTNGREQKTVYTYDKLERLSSFTDPDGTVSYTYDENGNVLTVQDENGTITREYDELNRITKYTDNRGNTVKYSYDSLGNLISLTYPGGKIVRYEYDKIGNLTKVTDWKGRVTSCQYDKNGRLNKTVRPNGTIQTTTFDVAGQVMQQKDVDGDGNVVNQYDYEYDAVGNVTVEKSSYESGTLKNMDAVMTYDTGNRLLTFNGKSVLYDKDGNMTYGPLNGQMVTFTYDSRNRLVKAGDTTYEYDAENNRTAVVEKGVRTEYINDPNAYLSKLLIKKDANGNETFYVYGLGLIGQEENGEYITYHYDLRGSTTALTDNTGNVTDRFEYAPYGELQNHVGNTKTPFLYNGRDGVMTDSNGLYYMRARYYNPDIKRFINQDIISGDISDGRTLNRYAYVNGNPISLTDPFGLSPSFSPSSIVHGVFDLVSLIDPTGVVDGINAVIYLVEGKPAEAAISFGCAFIPAFLDVGAKVARWGSKAFRATCFGQKIITRTAGIFDFSRRVTNTISTGVCKVRTTFVGRALTSRYATDAVIGAAFSAGTQKYFTGEINWGKVGKDALISVAAGKLSRKIVGQSDFAGGFCFTEDTLIATEDGKKQIKDIQTGDEVYSANPETGEKGLKTVKNVYINETDTLIHLFAGDEEIRTTATHPFWVEGKGWIDAGWIVPGDMLRTYDGKLLKVQKVEIEKLDEVINVYNFEVEDWHTYFVSDTEVLVHNMCQDAKVSYADSPSPEQLLGIEHANIKNPKDLRPDLYEDIPLRDGIIGVPRKLTERERIIAHQILDDIHLAKSGDLNARNRLLSREDHPLDNRSNSRNSAGSKNYAGWNSVYIDQSGSNVMRLMYKYEKNGYKWMVRQWH